MGDHTSNDTAYLPSGQITAWGRGIALIASTLNLMTGPVFSQVQSSAGHQVMAPIARASR
jgi:hypothetical protein